MIYRGPSFYRRRIIWFLPHPLFGGAESFNGEKAWSFINHSILSLVGMFWARRGSLFRNLPPLNCLTDIFRIFHYCDLIVTPHWMCMLQLTGESPIECQTELLLTRHINISSIAKPHKTPHLKRTVSRDIWFFSLIIFPKAPENNIRLISIFFENSWRYSQVKVHHRYQRHRRQILQPVLLVLLIRVAMRK